MWDKLDVRHKTDNSEKVYKIKQFDKSEPRF
jgi:hypothetical protein